MQEFINAFHFLRPWWLLLLVIPLFFYGRYLRGASNQSSWEKVCDKRLLDYLLIRGSSTQRKVMAWTALIGLALSPPRDRVGKRLKFPLWLRKIL